MRKLIEIFIVFLVLIGTGFLSGCIGDTSTTNQESPASTTYSSSLVYINRNDQGQVIEACVEVQNTGEYDAWFTVDFSFFSFDPNTFGEHPYGGGNTNTNDSPQLFHIEKQVYVGAHKSSSVICQPSSLQPAVSLYDYTIRLN